MKRTFVTQPCCGGPYGHFLGCFSYNFIIFVPPDAVVRTLEMAGGSIPFPPAAATTFATYHKSRRN